MTQAIVAGSLSAVAATSGASLAETFLGCNVVIIVDCSFSMTETDSRGGRTRYDVALEELAALQASLPGKLAVVAFSTETIFCPGGQPPFLMGGTNLAGALRFTKIADVEGMRFIVVSDGEPDSESEALAVAKSYQATISTIYVGPETRPVGRDFLQRLAAASGGQHVTADRAQELASKTQQLLLSA